MEDCLEWGETEREANYEAIINNSKKRVSGFPDNPI